MTSSRDPYVQDNGVLINTLGIRDGKALAKAEANLTRRRIFQLLKTPLTGAYDFQHYNEIHRFIFRDVYPWAGEPRTVRIGKGGNEFAHPAHLEANVSRILSDLAQQRKTAGTDRGALLEAITNTFADMNAAHPHREGNGRTLMVFLGQVAAEHGFTLKWENLNRDMLIATSMLSFAGNNAPLRSMLDAILHPQSPPIVPASKVANKPTLRHRPKL